VTAFEIVATVVLLVGWVAAIAVIATAVAERPPKR